jgi:hypothetical protein
MVARMSTKEECWIILIGTRGEVRSSSIYPIHESIVRLLFFLDRVSIKSRALLTLGRIVEVLPESLSQWICVLANNKHIFFLGLVWEGCMPWRTPFHQYLLFSSHNHRIQTTCLSRYSRLRCLSGNDEQNTCGSYCRWSGGHASSCGIRACCCLRKS